MSDNQTALIVQAIESAEKNLALAKKLLAGEAIGGPGIIGEFNGEFMITKEGQKHQVPPNYASKSRLVIGDTLRMIGSGEKAIFKQIKKVERIKISGVLTKKDGQWAAVAEEGSFFVLPVSVKHYQGEIGDEVEILIPKDYKKIKPKWAALERVVKEAVTSPKVPVKEKPVTPLRQGYGGQATEAQKKEAVEIPKKAKQPKEPKIPPKPLAAANKKPEVQKKEFPKTPKLPKRPRLKGEIKVEEELR